MSNPNYTKEDAIEDLHRGESLDFVQSEGNFSEEEMGHITNEVALIERSLNEGWPEDNRRSDLDVI